MAARTSQPVRENRLRRMAARQELRLAKSRRRDPRATDYGQYELIDLYTNTLIVTCEDLDQVEYWLTDGQDRLSKR